MPSPILTFAIPTWNRAEKLQRCLTSLANQIKDLPEYAEIFVSDHGSMDHTALAVEEVQRAFPQVHLAYGVLPRKEGHDFQHNFQFTFSAPTTPWTWTFGDDDVLLPGMLKAVLDLIKQAEPEEVAFIKVGEALRASAKPSIHRNLFVQLCNEWGWLEMCGYITGNVLKTSYLEEAVNLPTWFTYSKNAFPHACALLEVLGPARALFLDLPVVDCQDHTPTDATIKQWERNETAKRYFFVDEALADMVARGAIPPTYDPAFFRYHSYFLWDRLIGNMISQYSHHPEDPQTELWDHVKGLAAFLKPEDSHALLTRCEEVRGAIDSHFELIKKVAEESAILGEMATQHSIERFPWTYSGEPKVYPPVEEKAPLGTSGLAYVIWDAEKRQRRKDREWLAARDSGLAIQLSGEDLADFPKEE